MRNRYATCASNTVKINSKFRKEYFFRSVFLSVFLTFILGVLSQNPNEISTITNQLLLWYKAIMISLLIIVFMHLVTDRKQLKLMIDEKGIYVYTLFKTRPTLIQFDQIISHQTYRLKLQSSRVPVSDGALETKFKLSSGINLVINQDKYENYKELVQTIIKKYNSHVA